MGIGEHACMGGEYACMRVTPRCALQHTHNPCTTIPLNDGLHGAAVGRGCVACVYAFWNIHHPLVLCAKGDQCVRLGTKMLASLHHCAHKLPTLTESQCIVAGLELGDGCQLVTGSGYLIVDAAKVARPNVFGFRGASCNAVNVHTCTTVVDAGMKIAEGCRCTTRG